MAMRALSFWDFLTSSNHFPDFSVKYVGSSPMTEGIAMRFSLRPEFMISGWMFMIGTIPVCSRNLFYWVIWFFTVAASVVWMSPWGMKWI